MKILGFFAGLLLVAALLISGCTYDPSGVTLGKNTGPEISGTIAPVTSGTPEVGGNWVFWRESGINTQKGGYSYERPNINQKYFKDLKVEIKTDAPVDVRFVTLKQADDYMEGWKKYYEYETAPSFDRNDAGFIKFYSGVSDGSVEAHGDEGLIIFIEPHLNKPAKGTMKIYYKP